MISCIECGQMCIPCEADDLDEPYICDACVQEEEDRMAEIPGMTDLWYYQKAFPYLDFELTDDGKVVCTTIPN